MSKKLVAYFSASGVTKSAAERLAKAADADLFEIQPLVLYTKADLDWTNKKSRSSVEMNNPDSRPEIAKKVPNMEKYDMVFLGFPIWWYVAPTIINTFVESYDFSEKTVVPFATSGGSGMGKTEEMLRALCPNAIWKKGKMLNQISDTELKKWLDDIFRFECVPYLHGLYGIWRRAKRAAYLDGGRNTIPWNHKKRFGARRKLL